MTLAVQDRQGHSEKPDSHYSRKDERNYKYDPPEQAFATRIRQKQETLINTVDGLNRKFGKRVVTLGPWMTPPGGYAGGKIAYNRIPSAEDFW